LRTKPLLVIAALVLLASRAFPQEIVSAEKFFDAVSATYGQVTDYTAAVAITEGKNDPWKGRLSYKTPIFLRIDFDVPKGQVLLMDAEKLTIYVPGLEVVLVQKYKKKNSAALAAMASKQGLTLLRANYGVAFYSSPGFAPLDEGSKEQVVKLKLSPKSSSSSFRQIVVSVGKDNLIRRMEALAASGDRIVLDLAGVKVNQNVPDTRFQYDPPPYANQQPDFLFDSSE
jgi:outer membrane lipoprotein-sorting protein